MPDIFIVTFFCLLMFMQIQMSSVDSRILNVQIPSNTNVQSSSVVPNSQQNVKEWHKQINTELREYLVKKLFVLL